MTTAFLVLRLALGDFRYREVPFDRDPRRGAEGRADAGLVIHEGQLTYASHGLEKCSTSASGGCSRRACRCRSASTSRGATSATRLPALSAVLRASIEAGLANRGEAMEYALGFGRGLDLALADRFVGMYVNELTCDYGDEGRQAVEELLGRAEAAGAFEQPVRVEFVG